MLKSPKINQIAIDKTYYLVYNILMRNTEVEQYNTDT